jgi:hypothetical protein
VLLHRCSEFDLRWRERRLLEGQANRFAAALLFGGEPDAAIAESEASLAAVARLAAMTDTSMDLAFRRFVLRNPGRVWGLVCELPARGDPDEGPSPPALAVRHVDASHPSIWCSRSRSVALPHARRCNFAADGCPVGLERFRRAGAQAVEWLATDGAVLVLVH